LLLVVGLVIAGIGLIWIVAPSLPWLGHLPGDLRIERANVRSYFPVVTCLIDDEPNVLYSFARSLGSSSLRVDTALTAKEGLERVQQQRPDAVLLDVRLSDMSGLAVFERIHEIDARLPVILMTAYATTETAIEAMKLGAFEHLIKPVDFHQVRDVVARALDLSRSPQRPPRRPGRHQHHQQNRQHPQDLGHPRARYPGGPRRSRGG
jgi:DNA-binding NtrC family response regulator